jgi:hypothetical protein
MDAFHDNIDNHQMDQDAREGNVPSFNDSTSQIRKSSCISKPTSKVKDNQIDQIGKKYSTFIQALIAKEMNSKLKSLDEAKQKNDSTKWLETLQQEYNSLIKNDTQQHILGFTTS